MGTNSATVYLTPADDIDGKITSATNGDVFILSAGGYNIERDLIIDKEIEIRGA